MKLNSEKSKYMVVNFKTKYQFNTRLTLDNKLLNEVGETFLLGVKITNDLTWNENTDCMVKKAYRRMVLLHKLFEFQLTVKDMVEIYTLYIRSILESSAVVWHSSITKGEEI